MTVFRQFSKTMAISDCKAICYKDGQEVQSINFKSVQDMRIYRKFVEKYHAEWMRVK